MAGAVVRGRLTWQVARVSSVTRETGSVRMTGLEVSGWPGVPGRAASAHPADRRTVVFIAAADGEPAPSTYAGRPRRLDCAGPLPRRLASADSALVRSGRPTRRGPDAPAARMPGIHAGPSTRRRSPSPPPPVLWTGPTTRSGRTDRDRPTGRQPRSASPGQSVPGIGRWYVTWVQRRRTASGSHHQDRQGFPAPS